MGQGEGGGTAKHGHSLTAQQLGARLQIGVLLYLVFQVAAHHDADHENGAVLDGAEQKLLHGISLSGWLVALADAEPG